MYLGKKRVQVKGMPKSVAYLEEQAKTVGCQWEISAIVLKNRVGVCYLHGRNNLLFTFPFLIFFLRSLAAFTLLTAVLVLSSL